MKLRNGFVSNSSSSSFICERKMLLPEVKEKLEFMLGMYNTLTDSKTTYEETFGEPMIGTKEDVEYFNGWEYNGAVIGRIIINSASSNSIPSSLFELIEDVFTATRIHLG